MATGGNEGEEIGFDESDRFGDDDRVTLTMPDGARRVFMVVAEVELEDEVFAVLMAEDDDEGLFVASYDPSGAGDARYAPVDDDEVVARVQAVLDGLAGTIGEAMDDEDADDPS